MSRYILRRLVEMLITLVVIIVASFFVIRWAPGSPFSSERKLPAEVVADLDAKYGFDKPVLVQLANYMGNVAKGDLGLSTKYPQRTVNEIIYDGFPNSLALGFVALLWSLLIGITAGIIGAVRQNTTWDYGAMAGAMVGISLPAFVLGPLLILVFALTVYLFPAGGWGTLAHVLLPGITLGTAYAAYIARLTRGGMLEITRSDFIRTARAKGLKERVIIWRHMLKGGLAPTVTFLGPGVARMAVGSVVVEKIFATPGIGPYFVDAAFNRDLFLIMGLVLVYSTFLLTMNLVVDVTYGFLDPADPVRIMASASATPGQTPVAELIEGTSLWADAWKRLKKNKMAIVGGTVVAVLVFACFVGPIVISLTWGYDYETQDLAYGPQPPSAAHWFGTDYFGRDLMTRTMHGGQISLVVGLLAAVVAGVVGTVYGAVSGYLGGRVDSVMMRIVDIVYALPYMFLVIILVTIFSKSLTLLFLALGFVGWLTTARIVRGQVLSLKEQEFVQAARSLGAGGGAIVFRHLIPNTLGPIIVYFTLTVPSMILQEAFLSFLGLGVQPPRPSLGTLINEGAQHMAVFWWELVIPGMVMALLLFSLNFLGDGVRDALDPKMKN